VNCDCSQSWHQRWADVPKTCISIPVKLTHPRAIAVADISGSGNPDLVVTQLGGAPLCCAAKARSAHVDAHRSQALNDNKSALARRWSSTRARSIKSGKCRCFGYLGQNASSILAGLDTEKNAESCACCGPPASAGRNQSGRKKRNRTSRSSIDAAAPVRCCFLERQGEYEFYRRHDWPRRSRPLGCPRRTRCSRSRRY